MASRTWEPHQPERRNDLKMLLLIFESTVIRNGENAVEIGSIRTCHSIHWNAGNHIVLSGTIKRAHVLNPEEMIALRRLNGRKTDLERLNRTPIAHLQGNNRIVNVHELRTNKSRGARMTMLCEKRLIGRGAKFLEELLPEALVIQKDASQTLMRHQRVDGSSKVRDGHLNEVVEDCAVDLPRQRLKNSQHSLDLKEANLVMKDVDCLD